METELLAFIWKICYNKYVTKQEISFLGIPEKGLSCTNIIYNPQGREVNIMKQETITKAVKVINRNIKFYQRKLTYQLELRAEAEFDNGNLKVASFGDYESNIQKYEIILADLATIKRAINNNQTSVKIFGTADNRGYIYIETSNALKKAGFDWDADGFTGEMWLACIEEWEEEYKKEEERMAMQLNGLMAEFEE